VLYSYLVRDKAREQNPLPVAPSAGGAMPAAMPADKD
jgi:hypothetical protein